MSKQLILLKQEHEIAHLILNNPPKNEMDSKLLNELTNIRKNVFPSLCTKGMIIYGQKRHFSSGAHVEELKSLFNNNQSTPAPFLQDNIDNFIAIESLKFPVIAAITGCCLGLGLELALACNYRIATPQAIFSLPEATFGIIPGCGGTIRLPEKIKTGKAIEMILSGKMISAEVALDIGLIDLIAKKKDIIDTAEILIDKTYINFNGGTHQGSV